MSVSRRIRYLSHPQVQIVPKQDVRHWSLNALGAQRVERLARSQALLGTACVISSDEVKAKETATPLADALGSDLVIREKMHENDRSATGFLPPEEFEQVADQFFAQPGRSVRGWEMAEAAQRRIVGEVMACLATYPAGDLLFVGHGAVGTLLYCYLAGQPISRIYDQGPNGGGCYFEFSGMNHPPLHGWRAMEDLLG